MWKQTLQLGRRLVENFQCPSLSELTPSFLSSKPVGSLFVMTSEKGNILPEDLLLPPSSVNGMKVLEREKFSKVISIPYAVAPIESLPQILKVAKKYLLKVPNLNPVETVDGTSQKKLLFDPFKLRECLVGPDNEKLKASGVKEGDIKYCNIQLSYKNWLAEAIFKAVLPLDKEGVASWSTIGHIIHVNLREHLLDYKYLIGEVLLDKNKQALCVVNKANSIDSTYRTFQIEILAGEDKMQTQVKENHCTYEFDFSKVYWNPRLVGEHERIIQGLNRGDVLYDVFAGVGPFAIPAAKKHCKVLANDLNPESFKWLQHNIKINKVTDRVSAFNKDGGDFIRTDLKEDLLKRWTDGDSKPTHITMNLPAMSVEFLKHYRALIPLKDKPSNYQKPIIHVYCFIKNAADSSEAAKELVESELGTKLGENLQRISLVRTVSNNKDMMRVSFQLPEEVMFINSSDEEEPAPKKLCTREKDENNS